MFCWTNSDNGMPLQLWQVNANQSDVFVQVAVIQFSMFAHPDCMEDNVRIYFFWKSGFQSGFQLLIRTSFIDKNITRRSAEIIDYSDDAISFSNDFIFSDNTHQTLMRSMLQNHFKYRDMPLSKLCSYDRNKLDKRHNM